METEKQALLRNLDTSQVEAWVQQNSKLIEDTLRRFVGIPSENKYPVGNELQAQLEMETIMQQLGMETDLFLVTDVPGIEQHEAFLSDGRDYSNRPNVVGVLRGTGEGKSLIFNGHMDTVPIGRELWSQDPFDAAINDGKLYGLGIFDMKGGLLASLMALRCLRDLGYTTQGDVIVESVVDEEFGGSNGTLACILRGYEADAAIIPEPTNMVICPINQGGFYYRVSFHGRAGRSFSGEKLINPAFQAARFLEIIYQFHEWRNENDVPDPMFPNNELRTDVQTVFAGDPSIELGDRVPSSCSIDLWIQVLPGVTDTETWRQFTEFYTPRVQADALLAGANMRIEKKMRFLPGTGIDPNHPIVSTLYEAGQEGAGRELSVLGAPFACDSYMFNLYSQTPVVIFGPCGGNAHAPDEYIVVEEYHKLIQTYALTIAKWCGISGQEEN
ncbi:M20/M25/M40 family metallo-hydrolase [Paenibacillus koleovorans]|uniref:M20/M25/M40 family metallo-hydrolase n=1 Tax=Paenibacillus koleovorans TaxID=121608 RepID=UPI000FD85F67|nr:M20/M25/M40 family metallo-hydrolase [Paenibacillus koleovorans]